MSIHRDGMTAADHRIAAAECYRRERESFERSDTDGFLSQWASSITGQEHNAWADLLDNGGTVEVRALFLTDGRIASTHEKEGDYGYYWILNDEAAKVVGKRFLSDSNARKAQTRRANNAKKGVAVGYIRVKGYVTIAGSGTGLSGAASAYVTTRPVVDEIVKGNYEVVTTDAVRDSYGYEGSDWN